LSVATQEQLAKVQTILQHLDHTDNQDVENRRRAPRVTVRLPLDVIVLGVVNPAPVQVYTRNLSTSGMGFVSRRMFKSNERIAIYLRAQGLNSKLILGRISFARYAGGGFYQMGAEFLDSIQDKGNMRFPSHWTLAAGSCRVSRTPGGDKPDETRTQR
jgi:hypothetical protein